MALASEAETAIMARLGLIEQRLASMDEEREAVAEEVRQNRGLLLQRARAGSALLEVCTGITVDLRLGVIDCATAMSRITAAIAVVTSTAGTLEPFYL